MAVQPMFQLNDVEAAFVADYREQATGLPGSGDAAMAALRHQAIARFEATGLPHRRQEDWKYTDLRRLLTRVPDRTDGAATNVAGVPALSAFDGLDPIRLVFVDGTLDRKASDLDAVPDTVEIRPLFEGDLTDWALREIECRRPADGNAVLDLNTALMRDGVLIRVPDGVRLDRPILIAGLNAAGGASHLRIVAVVGSGAACTLIEAYADAGDQATDSLATAVTTLTIGDEASVTHIKVQDAGRTATHLAPHVVEIGAKATYSGFTLTLGAALSRDERHVRFGGEGSEGSISGAYILGGTRHADTTLVVDHTEPGCTSREQFRGIIDDKARGVFQGKLVVAQYAQKTDARQSVDALLLSDDAEHDAKPELEIYADDVQCAHGATSGELDENALFYLRSRGVPMAEAEQLLIAAFIAEGLEAVEDEALRSILHGLAERHLAERAGKVTDA